MKRKKLSKTIIVALTVLVVIVVELIGWGTYQHFHKAPIPTPVLIPVQTGFPQHICNCPNMPVNSTPNPSTGSSACSC